MPPLKMPPGLTPPEPMGGPTPQARPSFPRLIKKPAFEEPQKPSQGVPQEEIKSSSGRGIGPYLLMGVLAIILIAGILVFVSWRGWLSLGGLEKLWGGAKPSPEITPTPSPTPSPKIETSPVSSPEVTTNVNDQTRKADLVSLKSALEKYYLANSLYPVSLTVVKTSDSVSVLGQALVPKYLEKLPDDPLAPQYYYGYKSDGKTFELTCVLEDKSDPEGQKIGNYYLYKITEVSKE